MNFSTVSEWLEWISTIHIKEIDLNLTRVKKVAKSLNILHPSCPVITVAGTNGKGSTVATLESIYLAANYRVASFTSPFLFHFNEQIKINGKAVEDQTLINAFEKINHLRGDISLTPFEFHTLAALSIFTLYPLDVWILEVGLGGRLDAVNILDTNLAIITSISIDHTEWLGSTREEIGYEKAGICRTEQPVVCGDSYPPASLVKHVASLRANLYYQTKDFSFTENEHDWSWQSPRMTYQHLPKNNLLLQNMSTVLMGVTLLQARLPVQLIAIQQGLQNVNILGRIQIQEGPVTIIYDVAHNPAAIQLLSDKLEKYKSNKGRTIAVFSMLADKDISQSIFAIKNNIDYWYVAPLKTKRHASLHQLQTVFKTINLEVNISFTSSIAHAYQQALNNAKEGDRIIIFGSFHTVAEAVKSKQ